MDLSRLRDLAARWQEEAETLRHRGAPRQAEAVESCAEELEDRLREWRLERLTLSEAASEAGLSYSALQKKVSRGDLPNAGEEGAPRVRRADLFGAEPEGPRLAEDADGPDVAGEVLARRREEG